MPEHELPSPELLRKLVDYNPAAGTLSWKARPTSMFKPGPHQVWACDMWNRRYAGQAAFNTLSDKGYLRGLLFSKQFFAHRVVWAIHFNTHPKSFIDHINGDPTDNRIENLRLVDAQANSRNAKRHCQNMSGVTGVRWQDSIEKWVARITVDYKTHYLGCFDTLEEAKEARAKAEISNGFHPNHGRD